MHRNNELPVSEPGFEIDNDNLFLPENAQSKKNLIWKLRHSQPFNVIRTIPDFSVNFTLVAGKSDLFDIPQDTTLIMINSNAQSVGGALIVGAGILPPTPIGYIGLIQENAGAGNFNRQNLGAGFLITQETLFAAIGIGSLGLYAYAQNLLISIACWKNLEG